ncbi:DUF262 domain-containing protein [Patescibacteria group bacterium]|nr:DUF262 domain-containing protein [Patescibacteria group bacterium]
METKFRTISINQLARRQADIDFDPPFQREKIWSLDKKQCFLDSILKNWGVPKFYLLVIPDDGIGSEASERYLCIDGKQRLTTIFSFLADEIMLNQKYSGSLGSKYYKSLPRGIQDAFNEYKLGIEAVYSSNEEEVGELFSRLQLGSPLNFAEKLMAIGGKMRDFVKKTSQHKFFKKKVSLPNTRYAHFAVTAQICLLGVRGFTDAKLENLKVFFRDYPSFNEAGSDAKKIKDTLDYLNRMFANRTPELKNRASTISLFVLVTELMKRGDIRGKEKKLAKFFLKFMKDLKKEIEKGQQAKDADFLQYQGATTQGADKQKSIKLRHEILLKKLYRYDPYFYRLMNPEPSPEERFQNLYGKLEIRFKSDFNKIDKWLKNKSSRIEFINCRSSRGTFKESLPTHIRHRMHHHEHPEYKKSQLVTAIKILESVL